MGIFFSSSTGLMRFAIIFLSERSYCAYPLFLILLLLHADVASNWLVCFPFSARKHAYDIFFVNGLIAEVVQTLVPCLQQSGSDGIEVNAVLSNAERYGIKTFLSC